MHYNNPQLNEAKHESNEYLFIGEFNYQGEKDDKNGILYDFKRKFFFIGNFVKDCIKDIGYEVFIDDSKDIVDKMITVRLREEEKSEGHIEEIWQFPIDIKSIESDKPILEKNAIDEYESKLNKLFIDLIANDTIIRQFEKLYEMIIQYKRDIAIDTELNIEEIHKLNKGIQDIYMEYPEFNCFFPTYVDSTHNEQHNLNENKEDGNKEDGDHANKEEEVKENENNTAHNTETGMTNNID